MIVHVVIGFFIASAIVLFWLGRERRDPIARKGAIERGMSEAEVIASVGPPQEIRRTRDPLDPGFFATSRKETYVYANNRAVHFERGQVVGVSHVTASAGSPSPPPQIIPNPPPAAAPGATPAPFSPPEQLTDERETHRQN